MNYLLVGLGNIGPEYELTRHNIGFLVLDALIKKCNSTENFTLERHAYVSKIKHKGKTLILVKPTTFMNLSGKALNYWLKEEKINLENMLVITDDIALPFGKIRMRPKGSAGGHNGLAHIQEILETDLYNRFRIGIGSDFAKGRQAQFVLSRFNEEETKDLPLLLDKCADGILTFCNLGIEKAMNSVNK
ncbi:MAG: aminoacyl-tRNA hydrolase [Cytophagales bacterium]|nr:MAG: aminoacyl-tRNA hydrolase [Cytophagales bacterium]